MINATNTVTTQKTIHTVRTRMHDNTLIGAHAQTDRHTITNTNRHQVPTRARLDEHITGDRTATEGLKKDYSP